MLASLYISTNSVVPNYYRPVLFLNYGLASVCVFSLLPLQQLVAALVKMVGPAQLMALALVLWGGRVLSVKQVCNRLVITSNITPTVISLLSHYLL